MSALAAGSIEGPQAARRTKERQPREARRAAALFMARIEAGPAGHRVGLAGAVAALGPRGAGVDAARAEPDGVPALPARAAGARPLHDVDLAAVGPLHIAGRRSLGDALAEHPDRGPEARL